MAVEILSWLASLGYVGIFLGSMISSATILLPVPFFVFIIAAGNLLNPFIVAFAAGLGSAIGELTAYGIGFAGKKLVVKNRKIVESYFNRINHFVKGRSGFLIVLIMAMTPLPFDVIGLIFGAAKYNVKKFFIATFIGKTVLYLVLIFASSLGLLFLRSFFL